MNLTALTAKQVIENFPKRPPGSHKGMFGSVAVIGGASGMTGAALLAARATLKLGAGCVHVVLLADNAPCMDLLQPELMLHKATDLLCTHTVPTVPHLNPLPLGEDANVKGTFKFDVLAIGCGMGRDMDAQTLLHEALKSDAALVLDADALNMIAASSDLQTLLLARDRATVATPHPGEAARLLSCGVSEIQADRIAAVRQLARVLGCSVVLKGASSLCAMRDGRLFVNRNGNSGMSTAGMGDVLTGMIAAFIAQGMPVDDALLLAVHLHGAAGDKLAKQGIAVGMTATEVTDMARRLLNQWRMDDPLSLA